MKKSALTILFLTMFLVMLNLGVILPHLAYYAEELGASATQIGFLISIYSACFKQNRDYRFKYLNFIIGIHRGFIGEPRQVCCKVGYF